MIIVVGAQYSTPKRMGYSLPVITSMDPASVGTDSDDAIITILGSNFGGSALPLVHIDQFQCDVIAATNSTISCNAPVGHGENLEVKIKSDNQVSDGLTRFSYDAPGTISPIVPSLLLQPLLFSCNLSSPLTTASPLITSSLRL